MSYGTITHTWKAPDSPDDPHDEGYSLELMPYYGKEFDLTWEIEPADPSVGFLSDGVGDCIAIDGPDGAIKDPPWPDKWWEMAAEEANKQLQNARYDALDTYRD
jgi:hypothetical protein